jgi:glycosyltransferase involved in cell wall biosynthesis
MNPEKQLRQAHQPGERVDKPVVCMIAYTDYVFDARVRREAETVAAGGFRVVCLKTRNGARAQRYVMNGVEIWELGVRKYQGKNLLAYLRSYLHFLLSSSAVCARLLWKGELDVVHVHNLPDFLVFAGLLPRLAGRKLILDVHDSVPETFATKFATASTASLAWRALCLEERLSALVAHRVICVNHPQREALVARGIPSAKTFISMNVPDPAIFKRSSTDGAGGVTPGRFNVVYHGTMAERLGVDLLIRAVAQLRGRIPGLRLHLWGRGDDLAGFHGLAEELGTDDTVVFNPKGFRLEELPEQLRAMDLGVVGNRRSAASDLMLPVKLMEYVSLGIPAVVPRLRTIEHYFSDDMVAYYEPENVESLAASMLQLFSDPERRQTQARRAMSFLAEYGWERQGAELSALYQSLVEK